MFPSMFFGHSAFAQLYTIAVLIFLESSISFQAFYTSEGYYEKTLFGAIFISNSEKTRTWQGAVDECCARGGYLATFLDKDLDDLILQVASERYDTKIYWIGATDSASEGNVVWCLPGRAREPITSLLTSVSIGENKMIAINTSMNCVQFNCLYRTYKLMNCLKKLSFICKIEILFPESCFNPFYNNTKSALQVNFIHSAIEIEVKPGTPFYFKCDAKKYMAIMAQFQRVEAERHCKENGVQLLSVETITEMNCILNFFSGTMSSSYWTSGVNYGTINSSTYGWCSTGKLVDAKLWAEGEPMDPEGNRCVALTITEDNRLHSGLEAVYCGFLLPLICQIP